MTLTRREWVLLLATGTVALFGVSILAGRSKVREWKDLRVERAELRRQVQRDRALIATRPQWDAQLALLSTQVPQFAANAKVDIHWLSVMDNLASKNGVKILAREVGKEKRSGNIYELPIECREWAGTLESLTRFLFEMQTEGAMLDVRQLLVRPRRPGDSEHRGRFSLSCVYTREAPANGRVAEPEKTKP